MCVNNLSVVKKLLCQVAPLISETSQYLDAPVERAKTGLVLLLVLAAVPIIVALFFLFRFIYKSTVGKKLQTTVVQDYRKEAERHEKKGSFVSAARIYENRLKDYKKAAMLYEKGKDYRQAAELYDALGMSQKAKEMYEHAGRVEDAATVSMVDGEFEEAALLYNKAGKKIDAAKALETAGRKLAAARLYREAGEFRRAAKLLEDEGMIKEAAEMSSFDLRDKQVDRSTVDDFYRYALRLEKAGEPEQALFVFRQIDQFNPTYRDVREKIHGPAEEDENIDLAGKVTLRGMIKSGKIEPKHSLKLWLHILRQLKEAYERGSPYGMLSPDTIALDQQNTITFIQSAPSSAYASPESLRGAQPDELSDVYSAGVLFYEMLTGTLEGLGSERVIDIVEDVPEWLDEIVIKCIRKVKEDRYQSIDEIFEEIKSLSQGRKQQEI